MARHFTVRYHRAYRDGGVGLVVQDESGASYLFSGDALQSRLTGRLDPLVHADPRWTPVPPAAPYTLDGLRVLVQPIAAPVADDAASAVRVGNDAAPERDHIAS